MSVVSVPLLFKLPNAWLVALLSEWLDIPSIGKLDTATSSKQYRPQFLIGLHTMRSTSVDSFSHVVGSGRPRDWVGRWWRWLSIRQIYIENVTLRGKEVTSECVIPSLQKVVTYSFENLDILHLVFNCCKLRSLSLHTTHGDGYILMSHTGLQILTFLDQSLEELSF